MEESKNMSEQLKKCMQNLFNRKMSVLRICEEREVDWVSDLPLQPLSCADRGIHRRTPLFVHVLTAISADE